MIDGKTLHYWFQERMPEDRQYAWEIIGSTVQGAWDALAERIQVEMGKPLVVESGAFTEEEVAEFFRPGAVIVIDPLAKAMESKEPYKPGDVIPLGAIPPGTLVQVGNYTNVVRMPVQRVPGELRDKVYGASKEWWLTQLGFATPADEMEAEKIKQLSKATFRAAIENTLIGHPPIFDPVNYGVVGTEEEPRIEGVQKIEFRPDEFTEIKLVASASSSNEYSTHHKSCALRHDGIACTCP